MRTRDSSTALGMTNERKSRLLLYRFRFRGALLRINHHALQRVDCAQHLRIFRLDNIFLVFGFDISGIAHRKERALLLGSHSNPNIWSNAIALNNLFTRRIVFCSRQTHRGAVRQLHHVLYGALPESSFADKHGAMLILERSCNNLAASCAAFVHEQYHRKVRTLLLRAGSRVIMLLRSDTSLR